VPERVFQQVKGTGKKDLGVSLNVAYGEIRMETTDREFHESIPISLTLEQAVHLRNWLSDAFKRAREAGCEVPHGSN
jgi:hypothetical protein